MAIKLKDVKKNGVKYTNINLKLFFYIIFIAIAFFPIKEWVWDVYRPAQYEQAVELAGESYDLLPTDTHPAIKYLISQVKTKSRTLWQNNVIPDSLLDNMPQQFAEIEWFIDMSDERAYLFNKQYGIHHVIFLDMKNIPSQVRGNGYLQYDIVNDDNGNIKAQTYVMKKYVVKVIFLVILYTALSLALAYIIAILIYYLLVVKITNYYSDKTDNHLYFDSEYLDALDSLKKAKADNLKVVIVNKLTHFEAFCNK